MATLQLVESDADKRRIQRIFIENLQARTKNIGNRYVGWHGGGGNVRVQLRKDFWFGSKLLTDEVKTPRYWNLFGYCDPKQPDSTTLVITVEINIEIGTNSRRISGYFARDEYGQVWLMHSGRVGGGRPGIGKEAFLGWSFEKTFPVTSTTGKTQHGIPITVVDQPDALSAIERFVRRVRNFKEAATKQPKILDVARKRFTERERYLKEATGKRTARARSSITYETRHGEVVDALFKRRDSARKPGEAVLNGMPDLYVKRDGLVTEVYEVKMSCDRQSLYTAIGQLYVHSSGNKDARKTLVLPAGQEIAGDVRDTIESFGLKIQRFRVAKNRVDLLEQL